MENLSYTYIHTASSAIKYLFNFPHKVPHAKTAITCPKVAWIQKKTTSMAGLWVKTAPWRHSVISLENWGETYRYFKHNIYCKLTQQTRTMHLLSTLHRKASMSLGNKYYRWRIPEIIARPRPTLRQSPIPIFHSLYHVTMDLSYHHSHFSMVI